MPDQLTDLRDSLSLALDQLIQERDAANPQTDAAKISTAQAEAERLQVLLATVQFVIDNQKAVDLNAVAARLRDSVERQRAVGLSTAANTLQAALGRIGGANAGSEPAQPQPPPGESPPGGSPPGNGAPATATGALRAKPGPHQAVIDALIAGAATASIDTMTVLAITGFESGFDPTICNRISSAAGLFQFIDRTWEDQGGPSFPGRGGIGNGEAAGAPVALQVQIGCRFTADNIRRLQAAIGVPPSPATTYMAHAQGLTGALDILRADRNAPIESVIDPQQARNNGFGGMTVSQVIDRFDAIIRSSEDRVRALVEAVPSTSVAGPAGSGPAGGSRPAAAAGSATARTVAGRAPHVALTEMEIFARRGGAVVTERDEPLRDRVLQYFKFVGRGDVTDPGAVFWSAAFISFVMGGAGAVATGFPFSAAHSHYILRGLANRMKNDMTAPIIYFDKNEIAPRIGDLVGTSRTATVRNRADLERLLPDMFFPSHTDLVIDAAPGRLTVIGGNVDNTIKTQTVITDEAGKIDPADEHFFVLQINI